MAFYLFLLILQAHVPHNIIRLRLKDDEHQACVCRHATSKVDRLHKAEGISQKCLLLKATEKSRVQPILRPLHAH